MRYRDNLKKQYDMTRNDVLWELYKNARNDVNNIIEQAKCDYFKNKIDAVKKDPKQTWKLINELSSRKTSNTASIKVIKHHDREVTNATAVANAFSGFALHFTSIGEKLASEIDNTNINPTSYVKPNNTVFSFTEIQTSDVAHLLRTINSNKATGLDGIPGKILKLAADILSPSLTKLFNSSFIKGIYPDDWKIAKVVPVFKNGPKNSLNNYRPISIISAVAKIFGKLVHDQVYRYLISNDLLSKYQSGFRPNHSTLTALVEATNSWSVNIDKGLLNGRSCIY